MKSEVYLRSQLREIIEGLIEVVEHLPILANNDAASIYYAGYLAGLHAVATSVSIKDLPLRSGKPNSQHPLLTGRPD